MPKNIVLCFDGTGNQLNTTLTNVMKLYRCAEDDENQIVFYDPGVGTVGSLSTWEKGVATLKDVFAQATGYNLYNKVLEGYRFLIDHYEPGDDIYLFGFSRGAYTARVLAGFISLAGLLKPHQSNMAESLFEDYKRDGVQKSTAPTDRISHIIRTDTRKVPIKFVGVWDTVSSVIMPRWDNWIHAIPFETLPRTTYNPDIQTFRQALAIDERRRDFRPMPWMPPPGAKNDGKDVWFAGVHSDIGGGYPEDESSLSQIPAAYIIKEAQKAGLRISEDMFEHVVLGKPHEGGKFNYLPPDPAGKLHNSMNPIWAALEIIPRTTTLREWPGRPSLLHFYIPAAEPRFILDNANIDDSVLERVEKVPDYRPVNLPEHFKPDKS